MQRPTYASEESSNVQQAVMYNAICMAVMNTPAPVYHHLQTIEGIDYYTPNDEDWGTIVALDHVKHLAMNTGFYDMADFQPIGEFRSDYAIVLDNGKLTHDFRVK